MRVNCWFIYCQKCKKSTILPSFWPHFVNRTKIDYWTEVGQRGLTNLHQKNYRIILTFFSRLGSTRARARRALLQDIISAWSKSEGNFDFQSINSWPQNLYKVGKPHLESLSFLLVDLLRVIYKNSILMSHKTLKICPHFGLHLLKARSYWLHIACIWYSLQQWSIWAVYSIYDLSCFKCHLWG